MMLTERLTAPEIEPGRKEDQRLFALDQLDLLDTPREEGFDRIVRLICNIFDLPIAFVSLMDAHRQWHKACTGMAVDEAERRHTFCRYPVATGEPLVVHDARLDSRFADNPHVAVADGVRFYAGVPLRTADGHVIGTVCAVGLKPRDFTAKDLQVLTDLAQVATDQIELRQLAGTDQLTDLLSRRAFKEQSQTALALALRHTQPLSCVAIDIDHFKAVNDTHGHAAGDAVLKAVAEACGAQLRTSDIFGRIGGEEFAVLLPQTERAGALDVAEKLRAAMRRKKVDIGSVVLRVTASLGVASLDPATRDVETLLAHADQALYEAKAQGRDRCVAWRNAALPAPARRRVLKAGRILFNNRSSTIDCTVRSLGEDGASIEVWNALGVPDKFTLAVGSDTAEHACRVVKRADKHVEVEFN